MPECTESADCAESAEPICDDQICRACGSPAECEARDSAAPYCAVDGRCAACLSSSHCAEVTEPICDGPTLECRACVEGSAGDADCAARSAAQSRCAADGACVQCLDSTDCQGTAPFCDTSTRTCRACQANSECASELCRGRTVVDLWNRTGRPRNASVGVDLDAGRVFDLLVERIGALG
jgi:hypothetical protein